MKKSLLLVFAASVAVAAVAEEVAESSPWSFTLERRDVKDGVTVTVPMTLSVESDSRPVYTATVSVTEINGTPENTKYRYSISVDGTEMGSGMVFPTEECEITFSAYVPDGKSYVKDVNNISEYLIGDPKFTLLYRALPCLPAKQSLGYFNSCRVADIKTAKNSISDPGGYCYLSASGGNDIHFITTPKSVVGVNKVTCDYTTATMTVEKATEMRVTVGAAGVETLVLPIAASIPDGVQAYTLTLNNDGGLDAVMIESNEITANTPVLIKAEAGDYDFIFAAGATEEYQITTKDGLALNKTKDVVWLNDVPATDANALRGVMQYHSIPATAYTLGSASDGSAAFVKNEDAAAVIAPFRAYVQLPEADAMPEYIPVTYTSAGGTTGIDDVIIVSPSQPDNHRTYNLFGQEVDETYKGIVIRDGKKYLQK